MSHKQFQILEGACIISDAHYSHLRPELLQLIHNIYTKKLAVSQLILMGDICDALFGGVVYTYEQNRELIDLINAISQEIEVVYFEGNHDFNIKKLFPYSTVVPIKQQPLECFFEEQKIFLAHGDFDGGRLYLLYTSLIRSQFLVFILTLFDSLCGHCILKKIDAYLSKKDDCKEFVNFKEYIAKRALQKYGGDVFIEGHYHQNCSFSFENYNYSNLPAFACNQRYIIVKSTKNKELLMEENFLKEK